MPSEAQCQEPRDRGPPPPVTRAGRSAQLAKAAATNTGPERRPRGRPRKDGSSGRSAPPTQPPPPAPKSRKKGRSRGRAQVEDEESMDATEKKTPLKTEVKETPGRRRSTSRRKSNANPELSPDRLSPDPPAVTAPSAEEEDRTSPTPAASPGEGPRVSALPPSPVHSPASSPSPAPHLVNQDRQAPLVMDCSPCTVPMETDGGGANPTEMSPSLSPCSSPLASPCPRLEDEDSLSPLFQRSLSEDSGGSPTPSLGHTKKRLKQCAFCYRGDEPPLGQGRLVVFGPTPGYIPLHILNRRASSDRDSDCHDHCYRSNQAPPICSSPQQYEEESSSEFVMQLGAIGLPHDINVQSLFDPTGQCCAHLQCAAWSEGVCHGEGQSLLYVDKAIDSGSTQVCVFCHRLGATLRCQVMSCGRSYHFPCAAAAGAHQDWSLRHTLCTRHTHTVSSQCVSCSSSGDVGSLLMCSCCGNCYHGSCLDPPLAPSPLCRAGWQCPQCRVCQSCRLQGDDGVLLVCERCDKAYHTHCLTPPVEHTPSTGWRCTNCRVCRRCGVRSSGKWGNHLFLCESCDPAVPCPLCGHAPNLYSPQDYLTCICCYRCVHIECIVQTGEGRAGSEGYVCSTCRTQEEEQIPDSPTPALPLSSTQAPLISISQSPVPNHTEATPISPTAHSPVQLICLEPAQSPTKNICLPSQQIPAPSHPTTREVQRSPITSHAATTELQHSLASPHPDATELQQSPTPSRPVFTKPQHSPTLSHTDPTELQQSLGPSHTDPAELQQSPASPHPDPTELQQSPASPHPDPTELQQSPASPHPDPTELQQIPASPHPDPTELQQSPASPHPDPTELQQSPTPTHAEPTELQQSLTPTHAEPTELQQSPTPTHAEPTDLQQSPTPSHANPTELQQSPAPSHAEPTELQQSPAPSHAEPTELQQSPSPSHAEPTELQQSPAPSHAEPRELQQSPAPSHAEPTELQQSPAPSHAEPTELQQSPAPSDAEPTELQQSPAPSHAEPTELQQSPAPSHAEPTELQQSPAPSDAEPTELQQSPAPSHAEPTELQQSPAASHAEPTELQQSPAASHAEPTELQQSPAPSDAEPTELQQSPAPSDAEPTELQQSPAPSDAEPTELQQSPAPSDAEPRELQQSPAPSDAEPTELQQSPAPSHAEPTELQQNPAPSHAEPTELQQNPAPPQPDPTELQQNPVPPQPDPTELQQNPVPPQPDPTELQQNPAPSHPDPTELQHIPPPSDAEPRELQQSLLSNPDPTELQENPAPPHSDPTELQQNLAPPHPDPTKLQQIPPSSHSDPRELQESLTSRNLNSTEHQESHTISQLGQVELQQSPMSSRPGPAERQQSLIHVTSMHTQHSPEQLSYTPSSPTQHSKEDLMTTESHPSITQSSPLSCSYAHSPHSPPLQSQTQVWCSPTRFQTDQHAELNHSPLPHSPAQENITQSQLNRPYTSIVAQPQHSPPQIGHCLTPHSPAQICTSPPQSPTQHVEPTLDQGSPGSSSPSQLPCGAEQNVSTLDQDLSPAYFSSAHTARNYTSLRPTSAPCSPSLPPLRPTQCSLSEPASPMQGNSTKPVSLLPIQLATQARVTKSPNLDGQTLESSPKTHSHTLDLPTTAAASHFADGQPLNQLGPVQSSTLSPDQSSPPHVPAVRSPESLVHISTSIEHSSLTCSPCADEIEEIPPPASHIHQNDSQSCCTEAIAGKASPIHASEMPSSPVDSVLTCASPMPMVTIPAHVSLIPAETTLFTQPASPVKLTDSCSAQPISPLAPPVSFLTQPAVDSPISSQDEEMAVAVDHSNHVIQSETSPSFAVSTLDSPLHAIPTNASTAYIDSLFGHVHAQERTTLTVCSFTEFTQTNTSPTDCHSSPSHDQTSCSPSETTAVHKTHLPTPTSSAPPHCRPTDASAASSSVSHSLSNLNSNCSGHISTPPPMVTDVSFIHSPPRSSPAGHASPNHIQNISSSVHLSPVQRQTRSSASTTHCSPAHATVANVSPPHSPAQASETYCSPTGSPHYNAAPGTEAIFGLTVAQLGPTTASSSPDMDMVASSFHPTGLVKPTDSFRQASPTPASSLADDSSAVRQASVSQTDQSPASPVPTPGMSDDENQQSAALVSPLYQGPATPVEATSTQASPRHASPLHFGPTQDNTAMPSPSCSPPSQFSLSQTLSSHAPQDSSVHSLVSSPVCHPLQSCSIQTIPSQDPTSSVQPDSTSSPGPDSPVRCEARHDLVTPVLATPVQSETSPGPGPTIHVWPDPATDNIRVAEEQEVSVEQWKTEEVKRVPQEEEEEEKEEQVVMVLEPNRESLEEEEPLERTEGGGGEQDQEEHSSSNCHLSGVQSVQQASVLTEDSQSPPHIAAAFPLPPHPAPPSPQPSTPHSALPPQRHSFLPLTSPPASPHSLQQSPNFRAGSLEASSSSPPYRTALPLSCSPHTPLPPSPPLEDCPQEEKPTNHGEAETGIEETLSSHGTLMEDDSQSQSLFEPVATATEPTKDKHQSRAEYSEKEEGASESPKPVASDVAATHEVVAGKQPMREKQKTVEEEEGVSDRVDQEEVVKQGAEQEDQSDVEEEPMSPVLELDPSLDIEVMELMTSSSPPPSFLHISSPSPPPPCRGKVRTLRPPPCSSRPSDDLSIRLRQSPFSTEASPETSPTRAPITPPPLYPLSPPLSSFPPPRESPPLSKPQVPPTTVLPLTPKIGMGKPAISKRKFSPGRARVKQGSWWSNCRAMSPPSSSQDSTGEGGWDSPKSRPLDLPLWSMRVGRGSGYPGRRRSRGGGIGGGRGGRGRSRLKTQDSVTVSPGYGFVESFQVKEEEENSMHNTVVMFSTSDHFTLRQDMCVVCGSFGQGAEGRLLACSQCGQCYHPYCVNVKITRVVLTKGWRCLECTVCEACGEASDPGRLLLCDDCDISYHTYCLDPPLHTVPKGAWKCKWCVWCVQCGSTSPGLHCDWQSNYSRCGPCGSLSRCPLCQRHYTQDDLILQCQQCDRWVHAVCQGLTTEDEVEVAADEGFNCSLCRTHSRSSYGRSDSFDSPYMAQIISRIREPDTKTYTQDGVCLTESGLSHLQSLIEPLTSPRRYRRCKPKLKLRIINQNSVSVLQTPPDPDPPAEQDHSRGELDCEIKSDSSPERDHGHDDDITKEPEVTDVNKKRKRKPYRPGIGGFMVRQRGGKAGFSRIKLCRKDSAETLAGRDEGLLDADISIEMAPPADQMTEKVKKRYRKKKTKLEEAFPSYLQEAFFGRDLLDQSRQVDKRAGLDIPGASQSGTAIGGVKCPAPCFHGPSTSGLPVGTMATSRKQGALHMSEEALMDLSDVLNTDPHILATGHTGQFQVEHSPSPFAGLDIGTMADEPTLTPSLTSEPPGSGGRGQRAMQDEPLDAILSPELDKMVSDGAILSKLYKIPELEGKDVEEVFTAVLSPNGSNQPEQSQHAHTAAGSKTHTQHTGVFPRLPVMNGLMGAAPHFPNTPMIPSGARGPGGSFRMPPPESLATASANQLSGEGEQDALSTAQRSMLKWEKEEILGELATVAPVLYCNTNFPQLREQYPEWSTRVKQIAKLWRKASSQDRAPYVQKARDNRAAQRINKVQLSNEPLKRQPPQLPGPYDPVSMETDLGFKDLLRPKESEQEQEWKFRQGEVNDRWGAGKKRQENLPQSRALKSPTDKDCPYQASVAGGGKEALQMRQKSKQLAKIEATQKLEQVKNEQLLQQRQQQLLANQSPMMATQQHVSRGNASPLQPAASRDVQARQNLLQSSGLADDVFLRPQAPPPSGFSSLPHSPHPSSPLHQPPSSPQMFSPPSSRPSSPWDPYSKVAGTPRPTSTQGGGPPAPQQQRCNSLSASPAHDALGSPAPSPDSKTSDVSRALGPQPGLQQSRGGMMSPPSGSTPDHPVRNVAPRAAETYQRTSHNSSNFRVTELYSRAGEMIQGGVFKAPMPPQHQPQQEVFGSSGGRREPSRPTDLSFALPQSQDPSFPSSPLSGLSSPHCSPYTQAPGTPRPDYSQQITDPFAQQSPLTSRPSPDPYTNPQTPGTPCPHSDPTYLTTPPSLRLDQYNQQSANCRPPPSHSTLDPYASNPGTPRPSIAERFPQSPGSQRSTEHYVQPAGTPRPSPDPYAQQPSTPRPQKPTEAFSQAPVESSPHPARSDSSPLAPGLSGETVTFTQTHQHSPGRQQQQQDSFPRTPSSQTPKHPGISEESSFSGLANQTSGHDSFEQGHMTPGPSQTDKSVANEMAPSSVASLDGPMSVLPQLGDSEEKLRQRQRLRQLILRQQQQKSALRQEKGLQEPPAAPPGPATPRPWSQDSISSPASADLFGRPPPPYPGTVRPAGAGPRFPGGFPGEQQRGFLPSEAPFPRQSLPRELGVRGPSLRFCVPPGAPAGLQDSFLRPPLGAGISATEGVPVQMRRSMPGEFTAIRLFAASDSHQHTMPAAPQPFLPRSLPIQQHSIMGQPYIELRHRVPENRLRLPFSLATAQDPEAANHRDPQLSPARPGPGARVVEGPLSQQMLLTGSMEQLNQQDQHHLGHVAESTLPPADGIEEHLEGEDSAVKDLEDVEVKDLVDLNLNLDPEDGKEDLDLGPNDLHLDDFLLSGKFDLIAYADPELNLEDKKDMFNEELDLGEPVEEKGGGGRRDRMGAPSRKMDNNTHLIGQVKQEMEDGFKTEAQQPSSQSGLVTIKVPGAPGSSLTSSREKLEDSGSASGVLAQDQALSSGTAPGVHPPVAGVQPSVLQQQRPSGPPSALLTPQGPPAPSHPLSLLLSSQTKPMLLEEQPLLLQDLLDQERQEQQQQKQMQALIRQKSTPDPVFPNMADFDSISDPIMKAKMVALKGINKVMTQGNLGLNPIVINRLQQAPGAPPAPAPEGTPQPSPLLGHVQDGKLNPQLVRPNPPSFGTGFGNDSQRRQYEEWLGETQQLLQMQQRLLEDQIAAHRKTKKALSAKQRTAKKAGRALSADDAAQLCYITEQQGMVQKQLEQIRKQQKDHSELIEDYRTKQQQRVLHQQPAAPPMIPGGAPTVPQTLLSQPVVPIQPHPGGPAPTRLPNIQTGWTPGSGASVMGQRVPPLLPPQMPPTLPNTSQGALRTQTPQAMVPSLSAPPAGFTAGPNGAAGDGATTAPQVKFDDNNPFSEGFQERERRERLREQQERQRVQLMQEVERHRVLQQRLELEQQGLLGAPMGPGARVGPPPGPGGAPGDSLSQMPFFSSELPQDFLQSPPATRPLPQFQAGASFLQQGFTAGPLHPGAHPASGLDVVPSTLQTRPRLPCPTGPSAGPSAQVHPAGLGSAGIASSHSGGQGHRFGHDSSSSSPSTPLPSSFPCSSSGGPASLFQLYSDIIPDDKPKKKRSRKREGDDTAGRARTPLSSHSDDITAPPTPALSDTSCSTPTRGSMDLSEHSFPQSSSLSGLAPSSELERQLSVSSAQERGSLLCVETQRGPQSGLCLEVKEEREERGECVGGVVKMEEAEDFSTPLHGGGKEGDGGKELLRHLLKDKASPATTPSPTSHPPPAARREVSSESVRSEEEDGPVSHGNMVMLDSPGQELDSSGRKKPQRCKKVSRLDKDRAPPKNKRRKKDDDEKTLHASTSDPLVTHLRQLSVLPLVEPVLGVDLSLFPPYGSLSLGRDSRLSGSFGNACLDGVADYYSQLIYKNNLSNPPTPPASLPPTPPPVARQKLVNGFATTEELSKQDVKGVSGLKQKEEELLALNHASKTVDVPASLPTPPHNNHEELRVQDSSGRSSPDGFVPSSSPESVADMEVSRYPDLSFIKLEPPSPCPSPPITIMPCAWGKGSAVKQDVKAEPNHQRSPSCSSTDLVTIAITLNPVAAQNVAGVMAAMAELLRVPSPVDYQLSRDGGPSALSLLAGVGVPLPQGATGSRQRPPPATGNTGIKMDYNQHGGSAMVTTRPQCCNYCKVLLGNGVRIIKELKQEGQSTTGSSLVFCSPDCSALYTSGLQNKTTGNKCGSRVQHQYANNMSSIAVHSLPASPAATIETRPRIDSLKVKVKLKPHPRAVPGGDDSPSRHGKKIKSLRWRRWSVSVTLTRGPCMSSETVSMLTEDEMDVLLEKLGACLRPDPLPRDQRRCCFCHQVGDGPTDGPARLLNLDLDLWVHLNCALWSSEVYETQAGALINVEPALRRGLTLRCAHCQHTGATSGCNRLRCTNTYHFTCALQARCTFFKDKTMLCHLHKPKTVPPSGDKSSSGSPSSTPGPTPDPVAVMASDPYDCELRSFAVFRRVYVQRDEARQIAAVVQRGERQHTFRVGSLLFRAVGRLLPQQMNTFHNKTAIFPIGYNANRIYWSMRHSSRRCKYMCYIEEDAGRPLFKVKVVEKGHDDLILTGPTPKDVWDQILEPVSQIRSSSGTLKLFPVYLKGEDLFGLTTSAVSRIIESLPGVEACERYTFRYGRNPLMEWPLAFNPSGSARSEPKAYQAKRPYLLTSIAPRCQGAVGSIVGLVPGVIALSPGESVAGAHQGRHSKSSQYRRMKAEWKTNVYLARSRIQGLGLYAARDIEKCTMVIEYIGTIIRSEVANRKERLYESQNRGVYMFRIDNDFVIDATITGGPARYINHSCAPNCITEVVTVEKENKIIISSCRRIQRGEELSYDYKFDLEDDQHKIPCHCGAVNCRKWMN